MPDIRLKQAGMLFLGLILSSMLFLGILYDSYQLAKSLSLSLLLMLYCALMFFRKEKVFFDAASAAAFFLALYFAINGTLSKNNPEFFYTLTLLSPLLFVLARGEKVPPGLFFAAANTAAFISSAYSVIQFLTGTYRPFSFFGNPIFLAEFTGMFIPVLLASFLLHEKHRVFIFANTALALCVLFLASSRGAFISLMISVSFFAYFAAKEGAFKGISSFFRKYWFVPVILLSLFLLMPGLSRKAASNFSRLSEFALMKSQAVENRLLMSRTGLDIFKTSPLTGAGSGAVSYYHQKYQSAYLTKNPSLTFVKTSYVHNDWIHTAAEFGIFALLALIFFILWVFRAFDRASKSLNTADYVFVLSITSSFLFICTEAFFNFPLYVMPSALFFWLFAAVIFSYSPDSSRFNLKLNPKILSLAALSVIAAVAWGAPGEVVSNFYLKKGFIEHSGRTNFELDYLSQAYKINPSSYHAAALTGYSYSKTDRYEDAVKWYEKALVIKPYSADIYYNLGANLRAAGRVKEAETALKKAVELYPYFPEANMTLGKLYIDSGREEQGLYHFSLAKKSRAYFDFDMMNTVLDFKEVTK